MYFSLAPTSGSFFYICWLLFRALSHLNACSHQELITKTCLESHSKDGNCWMGYPSNQIICHIVMRKISQGKTLLSLFCMTFPLMQILAVIFKFFCTFSCNIPFWHLPSSTKSCEALTSELLCYIFEVLAFKKLFLMKANFPHLLYIRL